MEEEEFTLSLGLNFSLPPNRIDREDIFTAFEMFYDQIQHHKPVNKIQGQEFKSNLISSAHCYSANNNGTNFALCAKDIRKAVKELRINKSIIIIKPDIGSGAVVMDNTEYSRKCTQ